MISKNITKDVFSPKTLINTKYKCEKKEKAELLMFYANTVKDMW